LFVTYIVFAFLLKKYEKWNKTELFIGDNDRFIDSASIKPTLKSMIYEGSHFFTTKLLQQYIFKQ